MNAVISNSLPSSTTSTKSGSGNSTTPTADSTGSATVVWTCGKSGRQHGLFKRSNSADVVRSRYLSRLGISSNKNRPRPMDSSSSSTTIQSNRKQTEVVVEALKGDHGRVCSVSQAKVSMLRKAFSNDWNDASGSENTPSMAGSLDSDSSINNGNNNDDASSENNNCSISSSSSSTSTSHSDQKRNRSVSFGSAVQVRSIPHRTEFSSRIKNAIWTSPEEMQYHVARNVMEFTAEGWDWRQVHEEKDMVWYKGTPIHSVHFADNITDVWN